MLESASVSLWKQWGTMPFHKEMLDEFKMATGDVIGIGGKVLKNTCIPTGIKGDLVRSGVGCDRKR